MKNNCLISVTDKTGLDKLSNYLYNKYKLFATSGTAEYIREKGVLCKDISELTGLPEILDGRVKTLDYKIFAGLLFKRNDDHHIKDLNSVKAEPIDLVVCNFYKFSNSSDDSFIKNIDIGGVSITRAAAKNFEHTIVLTDPQQYTEFIDRLENNNFDFEYRKKLASEAFKKCYLYDMQNYFYLNNIGLDSGILSFNQKNQLAYGENPHQQAILINSDYDKYNLFKVKGPDISYNNILDINSALKLNENFKTEIFCGIFKHTNPCGAAIGNTVEEAYKKAYDSDPVSAYGSIVILNHIPDIKTAETIIKNFVEVLICPDFTEDTIKIFNKKKKLRLVKYAINNPGFKNEIISGYTGILAQNIDEIQQPETEFFNNPNIKLGVNVCKIVKSNAIVIVNNGMVAGIGAGQQSRIKSVEIALENANEFKINLENAVLITDGFFPFDDSIKRIKDSGIKTVVQPGGSKRDNEVIEACKKYNIKLCITGARHFRH